MVRTLISTGFVLAGLTLAPGPAFAHTDADLVAVAAGDEATITLEPNHGCDGSPTIQVAVRAPVEAAVPGEVDGWSVTAEPDGSGRTVLRWTGGVLPADQRGAFPVTFTAPDTVGALLTFPSVQYCENGDELAWISGDPASEFPAPRLLVLPAGSREAETLDEVPLDAPGRQQLVEVVDVDNPLATATTLATTPTTSTDTPVSTTTAASAASAATTDAAGSATSFPANSTTSVATATNPSATTTSPSPATLTVVSAAVTSAVSSSSSAGDRSDAGAVIVVVIAVIAVIGVAVAATVVVRRRRR